MTPRKLLPLALAPFLLVACKTGSKDPNLKTQGATWPSLNTAAAAATNPAILDAALVIAIEDYQTVDDIPGAKANGGDWVIYLHKTLGVPQQNISLLANYEATKEEILAAVQKANERVSPGGRLWFVFIGHGAPNKEGTDAWLIGADVQRSPASVAARSVSQTELLSMLESKQGVTPIVLLDACFNGKTGSGTKIMGEGLQDLVFVDLKNGSRSVVLSASKKDEFAGPLPGLNRPAFSYLMLGAMRGWGDTNKDGTVTVTEAVSYSRDALSMLLKGRTQTPEIVGGIGADQILSSSSGEQGPDLTEMQTRGAGVNDFTINGDTLSVPDAALIGGGAIDFNKKADIRAETTYGEALKIQKDEKAIPEERASKWCELARMKDATNPYRIQALKMCREWQVYAKALRDKETAMVNDYEYLRQYLVLDHKTQDQKSAACSAFLSGYSDMAETEYPHIRNVKRAERALKRKEKAKMPSLSDVKVVPEGSPGAAPTDTSTPTTPPGDTDADSIPDSSDLCPNEPGYAPNGCPAPAATPPPAAAPPSDRDGDYLQDAVDSCPDAPEDYDGVNDADGCPDP